ncbi:MAG: hypothetical protein ACFFBH_11475 [Promethearchaeota archaeon]
MINVNSENNPERLLKEYNEGTLKKNSLIDILISSASSKIDPYTAEQCIMILGNLGENEKIFKFLENCAISDIHPIIRAASIKVIF